MFSTTTESSTCDGEEKVRVCSVARLPYVFDILISQVNMPSTTIKLLTMTKKR